MHVAGTQCHLNTISISGVGFKLFIVCACACGRKMKIVYALPRVIGPSGERTRSRMKE